MLKYAKAIRGGTEKYNNLKKISSEENLKVSII